MNIKTIKKTFYEFDEFDCEYNSIFGSILTEVKVCENESRSLYMIVRGDFSGYDETGLVNLCTGEIIKTWDDAGDTLNSLNSNDLNKTNYRPATVAEIQTLMVNRPTGFKDEVIKTVTESLSEEEDKQREENLEWLTEYSEELNKDDEPEYMRTLPEGHTYIGSGPFKRKYGQPIDFFGIRFIDGKWETKPTLIAASVWLPASSSNVSPIKYKYPICTKTKDIIKLNAPQK